MSRKEFKIILLISLSFILLSFISIIIIINQHLLLGATDMQFHVKRLMELRMDFNHKNIFPMFAFNYFHGSSIMSIYPYYILVPFLFIFYLTSSLIKSYSLFFGFLILLSLFISFFSSLHFSKSLLISYMFSVIYSMSSTFIAEFFSVGDLGVTSSLTFMPLVIFGFIDLMSGSKNYCKLAIGIFLMTLCQISAVLITFAFITFWLLMNLLLHKLDKFVIIYFIKCIILVILLTSLVWIPLFNISLSNKINSVAPVQLDGFDVKDFVKSLSILAIVSIIFTFIYLKKLNLYDKQMYFLSVLVILVSSKLFPWKFVTSHGLLMFLNQFQFTLRFLIIPQLLLCYLFAVSFSMYIHNSKYKKIFSYLLILLIVLFQLLSQFYVIHRDFSYENLDSYRKTKVSHLKFYKIRDDRWDKYLINGYLNSNDYYLKVSNSRDHYINNSMGVYGRHMLNIKHNGYDSFSFNNKRSIRRLTLPFFSYHGECLHLYLNHHLIHYHVNKYGLITLKDVRNGDNELKIKYIPNTLLIVLRTLIMLFGIIWIILMKSKKCVHV